MIPKEQVYKVIEKYQQNNLIRGVLFSTPFVLQYTWKFHIGENPIKKHFRKEQKT